MAGRPYAAGGIRDTVAATRAASRRRAARRRRRCGGTRRAAPGTTHDRDQVRLRARRRRRGAAAAPSPRELTRRRRPSSAPTSSRPSSTGRADDYVALVCGEMLAACAPHARWIDVFCERGAFDADQSRAVLEAGAAAGLGLRLHANQLGPGPGRAARRRAGLRVGRPLHPPRPTPTSRRWPASDDRGHASCRRPTSPPASPTPTPGGLLDAGATVALATNCNPGSSYTTSMPFCIALAVRDMRHDDRRGAAGGHARRGAALAARRHRPPGARRAGRSGGARRPVHTHLVYRPGVPLVAATVVGARSPPLHAVAMRQRSP